MIRRLALTLACVLGLVPFAAAQGTITPTPFQTVLDSNGDPISAACVWTYLAGSTTPVATYTNVGLSAANGNPIIADTAGRFTAFLSPGTSYKFVYESTPCSASSHGSVFRTADNISAVPASSANIDIPNQIAGEALAAGVVAYLSDGSGGKVVGEWYTADSDNTYSSVLPLVGIVPTAIASGDTGVIRVAGQATGLVGLVPGSYYYIATTTGTLITPAPLSPEWVREMGQAQTASILNLTSLTPPTVLNADGMMSTTAAVGQLLIGSTTGGGSRFVPATLTAGTGITVTNGAGSITVSSGIFAHTSVGPSNPAGTTDNTGKMMGLAGSITPTATGTVLFCMSGTLANDTSPDGAFVQLTDGTGTPPANAGALKGTAIGSIEVLSIIATNAQRTPFGGCALVTGLSLGQAVWYDIRLGALAGGTATATSVVLTAVELP